MSRPDDRSGRPVERPLPPNPDGPNMGVLQDFERRLEGAVEGFFARAFRSGLQPIELAKALQRYAEDAQHVTADGVVVPNVYRVRVSPKDRARFESLGESLPRELAEVVVRTAADRGWTLRGPVKVRVDVDEGVRYGMYELSGRVEVVGQTPARAEPAPRPAPAPAATSASDGDAPGSGLDHTQVVSAVPRSTLALKVTSGSGQGASVPVVGTRLTMGRLSSCDLVVQDSTVSREHAALVRRGDRWWVIDLGSTNGTRVNGVQAAEQPVSPGDQIELGDATVQLVEI